MVVHRTLPIMIKWRLAAVMADREMDYKDVAVVTGLSPSTVSTHKNLREMPPRLDRNTLNAYCHALNCQPGDLLRHIPDEDADEEPPEAIAS
jgi:putative transcriptional regulator